MVLNVADLGLNTSFPVKASTSPTLSLCFMALWTQFINEKIPTLFPIKPGVSLHRTTSFPSIFEQ